ncbi:hypothetical protein C8N43_0784 [Litoreibacter ponti]|uniref:Uncharacterized protein n=1 Tax=Litoreibacter ponti TaxID=1510457 RepID=A0A2T6BJ90_9RHOB|nr:hypothetical protein [Litoreibacter ponti]PTX56133.1 hypothetical protein C8N43_0784 [Litoreibacter ponti]
MPRALIIAGAAATIATSTFAYEGASDTMVDSVDEILNRAGYDVPVTSLTDQQIVEIYLAGNSSMSPAERTQRIETVLENEAVTATILKTDEDRDWGLVVTGEHSVKTSVQNYLDRVGLDVDADALTEEQVAQIYFAAFGSDGSPASRLDQIEDIISN